MRLCFYLFGNEILISQCKDIVDTQEAATLYVSKNSAKLKLVFSHARASKASHDSGAKGSEKHKSPVACIIFGSDDNAR